MNTVEVMMNSVKIQKNMIMNKKMYPTILMKRILMKKRLLIKRITIQMMIYAILMRKGSRYLMMMKMNTKIRLIILIR